MKKYDDYKDSGIEWIGEIPKHWSLKKIKHTTYVKGRIGWQGLRSDEFLEEAESLVVTGTDFIEGKINWKTCYQIPIERYNEDINIQLKENDLLITKDGTIGKVSLVKNMPKIATLNSGVFLTRPLTNDYITKFMYWVLVSEVFKTFYDFNKSGSTIQHLYQYVFNEFDFTKPSIEEQTQIANYLDHKTTQIDRLISKKQQSITLLQEERIAVINQAVTKGLDPKVKMKDTGIEWLGKIPEHWEVKRLKYCFKIFGGFAFSSSAFTTEGVQIVKIGNLYQNQLNLDRAPTFVSREFINSHSNFLATQDDILMSLTGTLGKRDYGYAILVRNEDTLMVNQRVALIKANDDMCIEFSINMFHCESYLNQLYMIPTGTKQGNLSCEDVLSISMAIPSKEEQLKIGEYLKQKSNEIDVIISKTQQEIELLKEYKAALISEVVTGKVDIRDELLN